MSSNNDNRGLASADEETKERVAKKGGEAPHEKRGLQAADEETKERVAREGGKASHKND
jgi:general stress protein YciG